jgi:hypothetical protein
MMLGGVGSWQWIVASSSRFGAFADSNVLRPVSPAFWRYQHCCRYARSAPGDAVRHSGLDVTVHQSDSKRAPGHLSREGPELLRWALFEAALSAARAGSPDHAYYLQVAERIDHNRACLSVARKLCRRALPHPARARRRSARRRRRRPAR